MRVKGVSWERGEKEEVRNARIRILSLKLCPADPEVWTVEEFVVGFDACICVL